MTFWFLLRTGNRETFASKEYFFARQPAYSPYLNFYDFSCSSKLKSSSVVAIRELLRTYDWLWWMNWWQWQLKTSSTVFSGENTIACVEEIKMICNYIDIFLTKGALSVTVIVVGNEIRAWSSNLGRTYLRFTSY